MSSAASCWIGTIGSVEIGRVEDCVFADLTADNWLPQFDPEAVAPHVHWLSPNHYHAETGILTMPVHSFVLRTRHHTILIDTCVGNHKSRPGVTKMDMLQNDYLGRLAGLGIRPEDIDYVMCTHLHSDHVGWNTRLIDGKWKPTFPNARHVMSTKELAGALAESEHPDTIEANRNAYHDSVVPILEAGLADLIEDNHEMLDLLRFVPAPGHTPGNMRIELTSANDQAVFAGDILHSPMQVPFWQWSSRLCADPVMAAESRRRLLEHCTATGALLMPGHFAAPHVGRIRTSGDTFAIDFGW